MKKIFIILFFLIIVLVSYFYIPRIIYVKSVTCRSQYGPCSRSIINSLLSLKEKPLSEAKREINKFLSNNYLVESFSVRYRLPSELVVNLIEKKAEVALEKGDLDYILIDRQGNILGKSSETNLPKVVLGQKDLSPDQKIFVANLLYEMFRWQGIDRAYYKENGIEMDVNDNLRVIFPNEGDVDVLLGSLKIILSWLNSKSKDLKISYIDLRYNNPVIR